jgi:hypothetical protein
MALSLQRVCGLTRDVANNRTRYIGNVSDCALPFARSSWQGRVELSALDIRISRNEV